MSRDDGWRFLVLGRSLERVDMTDAAAVGARYGDAFGPHRAGPRRCAAARPTRRTCAPTGTRSTPSTAVEFLLLDRLFPRSVFHALTTADNSLGELDPRSARAGVDDEARRRLGRVRAELEFLHLDEAMDDLPSCSRDCSTSARDVHAAIAAPVLPRDPRDRVERLTMSWRLRVRHTTTYQYAGDVHASYNEARISPLDTAEPVHARAPRRGAPGGEPLPVPRLLGQPGARVRPAPAAHRAHRGRVVAGGDGGAHAEPRRHRGVGRHRRAGPDRPVLRVPHRHHDDRVRRRHPAGRARSCGETPTPAAALSPTRASGCATHVEYETGTTSVSTTAVEALRAGRGRVPGLRAPRHRGAPRRRHPGPLRVGLPLPRRAAAWSARCTRARATRGSRRGSATGTRSTRPAARRSPSATCSSRAAATTPTSRRSRACTTAARATRSTSRWS